jgi:thiosulfate dehydrogenase
MTNSTAHRTALIAAAALCLVTACKQAKAPADAPAPSAAAPEVVFAPPALETIPDGPQGDAIRRGRELFLNTAAAAPRYVGSGLTCSNCHLDEGRKADASPMWAAWGMYPVYREKNDQINTMEDRIQGCFTYSMNAQASPAGAAPPYGDDIYRDLQTYFAWLATGAPSGREMKGRGFVTVAKPALTPDTVRGAAVYQEHCIACHQPNGEGLRNPDGTYAFPPLWGDASFNWGAGMSKTANAAGFIKVNMPQGQEGILSDQQAWDVAAYMTSRERPRDPRQTGSIEDARQQFHSKGDYYGQRVGGDLLGDGK